MKIFKTVTVLLSVIFIMGIGGCDRDNEKLAEADDISADPNPVPEAPSLQIVEQAKNEELEGDNPILEPLSPKEYGRENPFIPLVVARSTSRNRTVPRISTAQTNNIAKKKEPKIIIKVTAILGNSAIIEEGNAAGSVSIGDTIGGMEVLEIKSNGVTLGRGSEKHKIAVGKKLEL